MRIAILLVLLSTVGFIFGCTNTGFSKSDILGYEENDELAEVKITYELNSGEYGQTTIDDLGVFKDSETINTETLRGRVKISGDGTVLASSSYESIDTKENGPTRFKREAYVYYIRRTDEGWVEGKIGQIEPSLHSVSGFVISGFAIASDGKTGLISNFENAGLRYTNDGEYEKPTTVFIGVDFENGEYYELPNQPRRGAFCIYYITDSGRILAEAWVDSFEKYGGICSFPDYSCSCAYEDLISEDLYFDDHEECYGLSIPVDDFWRFERTNRNFPRGTLADVVYSDEMGILVLYKDGDDVVYKSYSDGAEKITELFRAILGFINACTTHDGKTVIGISEPKLGELMVYQIDTDKKEYRKYPIEKGNSNGLRGIKLVAAHAIK